MLSHTLRLLLVSCCLLTGLLPSTAAAQVDELDAFWSEVSRTVSEGDFEGYSATYHPDAVLVSSSSNESYPIAQALAGWKPGFDDTKDGRLSAGVDFRFTQRLHDGNTAHETGIFRYWSQTGDADPVVAMVHFEGLLVRKDGWLMVMEYQKSSATFEEWEAAK